MGKWAAVVFRGVVAFARASGAVFRVHVREALPRGVGMSGGRFDGCCGGCSWLAVPLNKAGRQVPVRDRAYQCEVPYERPVMPASVALWVAWKHRRRMLPTDGAGCAFYCSVQAAGSLEGDGKV